MPCPTCTVIIGTRPEAIKMAPVITRLHQENERLQTVVVTTGQHTDMVDQVLKPFGIKPDEDLDIMRPGQSLTQLSSQALESLSGLFNRRRSDLVLVEGDTTSVLMTALAAFYERIPVGHVEAGLRTGDKSQPYPEEINRRLVGGLADLHFAPTPTARENLLGEGIPDEAIHITGNPVIDALTHVSRRLELTKKEPLPWLSPGRRLILMTAHRRENWGEPIEAVCRAVLDLVERFPDVDVLYPVHPNPQVQEPVRRLLGGHDRIHLTDPLDYRLFVLALQSCVLVLTDSGGLQEEAPSLGKPVLVLRDVTERPEAVEAGTVKLVGTDTERIIRDVSILLTDPAAYDAMARRINPYGDGHAAERIVQAILHFFGLVETLPQPFAAKSQREA